jgi:hypothetical protein
MNQRACHLDLKFGYEWNPVIGQSVCRRRGRAETGRFDRADRTARFNPFQTLAPDFRTT